MLWPEINNVITHPLNTYIQNTMKTVKIKGPHLKKIRYNSIENLMCSKAYFYSGENVVALLALEAHTMY